MSSSFGLATIFVKGYSESTVKQQIEGLFERFGTIKEVKMIKNFAFVSYANQESANAAVQQLHNTNFKGERLIVEISGKQRSGRQSRLPTIKEGDKCHACGKQGHWARQCPQKMGNQKISRPPRRERSRERNNGRKQQRSDRKSKRRERSSSSSLSSSSSSSSYSRNSRRKRDDRKRRRSYSSSKSSSSSSRSSSSHSSKE